MLCLLWVCLVLVVLLVVFLRLLCVIWFFSFWIFCFVVWIFMILFCRFLFICFNFWVFWLFVFFLLLLLLLVLILIVLELWFLVFCFNMRLVILFKVELLIWLVCCIFSMLFWIVGGLLELIKGWFFDSDFVWCWIEIEEECFDILLLWDDWVCLGCFGMFLFFLFCFVGSLLCLFGCGLMLFFFFFLILIVVGVLIKVFVIWGVGIVRGLGLEGLGVLFGVIFFGFGDNVWRDLCLDWFLCGVNRFILFFICFVGLDFERIKFDCFVRLDFIELFFWSLIKLIVGLLLFLVLVNIFCWRFLLDCWGFLCLDIFLEMLDVGRLVSWFVIVVVDSLCKIFCDLFLFCELWCWIFVFLLSFCCLL